MKGKSRKILLLTWPQEYIFPDGQPSAFTRNFFLSLSALLLIITCQSFLFASQALLSYHRLWFYLCLFGLTSISGRAGGHTVRPGPLVGLQPHLMLSPSCRQKVLLDFFPLRLIGFVFKFLLLMQLVLSACSHHRLLHSSTPLVSPPPASWPPLVAPSPALFLSLPVEYRYSLSAHLSALRWPLP